MKEEQKIKTEEMKYVKPEGGTELDGRHPMELVGRILLIKNLREIGAKKVSMLVEEERAEFITKRIKGLDQYAETQWEINYEFAIFEATDDQWERLMSNFMKRAKPNPTQQNLISPN